MGIVEGGEAVPGEAAAVTQSASVAVAQAGSLCYSITGCNALAQRLLAQAISLCYNLVARVT